MKCPNPQCKNTALDEHHVFCFQCGCEILKAKEELSSPSIDDNGTTPVTNAEFSDVQKDTEVSLDGGQRKRKDDGEVEGKPAKRKSAANEDDSVPVGVDDVTETALQNLQLANNPSEVKQNTVPVTLLELVTTTEHPLSDSRASDPSIKQASSTGYQPTDVHTCLAKESTMPEVGSAHESENLLGTSSSSNPDANMQQNQEEEDVRVRREDKEAESKSNKSAGSTVTKQSNGDDMGNGDSTYDSDSEKEDEINEPKESIKRTVPGKKEKSTTQLQREKKQVRKKKRLDEQREEIRKKNEQDALKNPRQQKGDAQENQHDNEDHQLEENGKENETKKCHVDNEEKNKEGKEGYFDKHKGKKMTIVFHAVLSPHFKFEKNQGDRIFMRFGRVAFGRFLDDVVEVHPERCLENGFILVQATLMVPCVHISSQVPYKYVVFKAKRKNSKEKEKYLWEHLVDFRATENRCLQIPKGRCQTGAIWHQYDDTIFSSPDWFQSIRNKIPFLKSMDPVDGRNIATWAMLPRWEGFTTDEVTTSMTAWEAVEVVNDVAYCMTQTLAEESGRLSRNVPFSYDFRRILRDFFKEKIDKNSLPQSHEEGQKNNILPLVSSVAIAYTIYVHKVHLEPQEYAKLFSSLVLRADQENHTCSSFERLLKHFPSEQWQKLGEAIQGISRHVAKSYHNDHDWLFAVPLVHFLTQVSRPFGNFLLLMEKPKGNDDTWWGASGFDTKSVRERMFTEQSCPSLLLNVLGPLFELDPLSRRTFLLVVPLRQFGKIASSGQFSPVEMYTTLARHLSEKSNITEKERDAVATALSVIEKDAKTTSEMKAKE